MTSGAIEATDVILLQIIGFRGVAIVVAIAALVGFLAYERHKFIIEGETNAKRQIEQANEQALQAAIGAARTVDDCYSAGGDWDRAHGVCVTAGH